MAVAFGCEGEVEGAETGSVPAAMGPLEWADAEVFEDVSGHTVALRRAVDLESLRVDATPKAPTDFKFQQQFDGDGLKQAGFGRMPFGDCFQIMRGALKLEMGMSAKLNANDSGGVDLDVEVPVVYFSAKYKLPLEKAHLRMSDKLLLQLCAANKQLAAARIELAQMKAAMKDATPVDDASKQQLAEAKQRVAELLKAMAALKAESDELSTESASLKSQLSEATAALRVATGDGGAKQQLAEARDKLAGATRRVAELSTEVASIKAQAAAECRSAEEKLVKAKERMAKLKKRDGAIIEELRETNASIEQRLAAATKEMADGRIAQKEMQSLKSALAKGKAEMASAKQRSDDGIAKVSKEIESLKCALAEAKAESKRLSAELSKEKAQATAGRRSAERRLFEAKAESGELKSAMEVLREANAKAKAQAAADHSAADDLRAEIRIRQAEIEALKKAEMLAKLKTTGGFIFDTSTKGGMYDGSPITDPKKWKVSRNRKTVTAKKESAQILIAPALTSDSQITIEVVDEGTHYFGVGVTDDYSQWLHYGCAFYYDGDVRVKGSYVAESQAFGDWHSGDRLFVSANLSSGTVSIRAPNCEFTQKWTPTSSPIWFAVYFGAGTKLRIID